jgi:predicted metal-dependent phosphoesterase TrpH
MLLKCNNYNQDRLQENVLKPMKERIDTEPRIKRPRPLKADLHLHTAEDPNDRVSYTAKELISKAADQGFEVLAITNHECLTFNKRLSAYARELGILLIPGMEINVRHRHVLFLNPPPGKRVSDFSSLFALRRPDNLIIAPHPYYPNPRSLNGYLLRNLKLFDAIEYCHFYSSRINFNQKAVALSKLHGMPLVGNSDTHFLPQLGTTYSLIYAEKEPEAIFEAIRQGKIEIVTRPLSHLEMGTFLGRFFSMKIPIDRISSKRWRGSRIRTKQLPIPFRGIPLSLLKIFITLLR